MVALSAQGEQDIYNGAYATLGLDTAKQRLLDQRFA